MRSGFYLKKNNLISVHRDQILYIVRLAGCENFVGK